MTTADDPVHFLPTGEIQVQLTGPGERRHVTLPRPSFGQIRKLIRAEGATTDQVNAVIAAAQAVAQELIAGGDAASLKTTTENLPALTVIRDKARAVADDATDQVGDILGAWWTQTFEALGLVPPDEERWPSVFMDASLPGKVIAHWRFVPTGPG